LGYKRPTKEEISLRVGIPGRGGRQELSCKNQGEEDELRRGAGTGSAIGHMQIPYSSTKDWIPSNAYKTVRRGAPHRKSRKRKDLSLLRNGASRRKSLLRNAHEKGRKNSSVRRTQKISLPTSIT